MISQNMVWLIQLLAGVSFVGTMWFTNDLKFGITGCMVLLVAIGNQTALK